eukprot:jgi/Mesvir1/24364/Mv11037-RA.1
MERVTLGLTVEASLSWTVAAELTSQCLEACVLSLVSLETAVVAVMREGTESCDSKDETSSGDSSIVFVDHDDVAKEATQSNDTTAVKSPGTPTPRLKAHPAAHDAATTAPEGNPSTHPPERTTASPLLASLEPRPVPGGQPGAANPTPPPSSAEPKPPPSPAADASILLWANSYLQHRKMAARDLSRDFSDGVRLINLIEIVFRTRVPYYHARPRLRTLRVENLTTALEALHTLNVSVASIVADPVVDGDPAAISGVLWTLLAHAVAQACAELGLPLSASDASDATRQDRDNKPLPSDAAKDVKDHTSVASDLVTWVVQGAKGFASAALSSRAVTTAPASPTSGAPTSVRRTSRVGATLPPTCVLASWASGAALTSLLTFLVAEKLGDPEGLAREMRRADNVGSLPPGRGGQGGPSLASPDTLDAALEMAAALLGVPPPAKSAEGAAAACGGGAGVTGGSFMFSLLRHPPSSAAVHTAMVLASASKAFASLQRSTYSRRRESMALLLGQVSCMSVAPDALESPSSSSPHTSKGQGSTGGFSPHPLLPSSASGTLGADASGKAEDGSALADATSGSSTQQEQQQQRKRHSLLLLDLQRAVPLCESYGGGPVASPFGPPSPMLPHDKASVAAGGAMARAALPAGAPGAAPVSAGAATAGQRTSGLKAAPGMAYPTSGSHAATSCGDDKGANAVACSSELHAGDGGQDQLAAVNAALVRDVDRLRMEAFHAYEEAKAKSAAIADLQRKVHRLTQELRSMGAPSPDDGPVWPLGEAGVGIMGGAGPRKEEIGRGMRGAGGAPGGRSGSGGAVVGSGRGSAGQKLASAGSAAGCFQGAFYGASAVNPPAVVVEQVRASLELTPPVVAGWLWKTPVTSASKGDMRGGWKRRWCVLQGGTFAYYDVKGSAAAEAIGRPPDISKVAPKGTLRLGAGSWVSQPTLAEIQTGSDSMRKIAQSAVTLAPLPSPATVGTGKASPPAKDSATSSPLSQVLGLMLTLQGDKGKICLRTPSEKEARAWLPCLRLSMARAEYLDRMAVEGAEPDPHVLAAFAHVGAGGLGQAQGHAAQGHYSQLKSLCLDDCFDAPSAFAAVAEPIQWSTCLATVSAARARAGDAEVVMLAPALQRAIAASQASSGGPPGGGPALAPPRRGSLSAGVAFAGLTMINLSGNRIGPQGASVLGQVLRNCGTLRELVLDNNVLADEGVEKLSLWLWGTPAVVGAVAREVMLPAANRSHGEDNPTGAHPSGGPAITAGVPGVGSGPGGDSGSRRADLSRFLREHGRLLQGAPRVAESLRRCSLRGNRVSDRGVRLLAHCLSGYGDGDGASVTASLVGAGGGTGGNGVPGVAPVALRALELADNRVGDTGARSVAHALAAQGQLAYLEAVDLLGNQVTDDGAAALAASLLQRRKFQQQQQQQQQQQGQLQQTGPARESAGLGLQRQLSSAAGMGVLDTPLRSLSLRDNHVGEKGAVALGQAVLQGALRELDLGNNDQLVGGCALAQLLAPGVALEFPELTLRAYSASVDPSAPPSSSSSSFDNNAGSEDHMSAAEGSISLAGHDSTKGEPGSPGVPFVSAAAARERHNQKMCGADASKGSAIGLSMVAMAAAEKARKRNDAKQ